jgi:1,4-dihydroxy-2-naphthoate octaprenyltransferase
MDRLRPLTDAARLDRAMLAPCAVFVGSSYARYDAQPGPGLPAHVVVSVAALLAAAGVNFVDEAWDLWGAPPSDGLDAREAALCGAACLILALLVGAVLVPLSGAAAVGYGLVAVLLGVIRGIPVAGLDTLGRGLGDVANAVALGPLAVSAGFASQCGHGGSGALLVGVPAGIVAAGALYTRHFTRPDADLRHERLTPVVVLGEDRARMGFLLFPLGAALAVAAIVALEEGPAGLYAALAPLAVLAGVALRSPRPPERSICIVAATALLVLAAAFRLAVR